RSNVSRDFASDGGPAMPLHLAVVCAEDYPRLTPQLLAEDTRDSFLGAPQIERIGKMCGVMPVPAVPYVKPSMIDAPVLMLSGASFTAQDGKITALLGPNGAGKTTLLRTLVGLLQRDQGTISIDGVDPAVNPMAVRRNVGVLTDQFGLYDRLTTREYLAYF